MLGLHQQQCDQILSTVHQLNCAPLHIGQVQAVTGNMITASGFPYPIGQGAIVETADGSTVEAEVSGIDRSNVLLTPLKLNGAIRKSAAVYPSRSDSMIGVGPELLGRVINALGQEIDGNGPIATNATWRLHADNDEFQNRGRVSAPLDIGVRAINALLTIGRGQRVAIIAGSGVGKTMLMHQLISSTEADVIVVGLIGERAREIADFVEMSRGSGANQKTITIAVPADHSPLLRIKAAHRTAAIAEYYRSQGNSVLLFMDSLTRVAHAQREIGLSLGEPPTMKGYPPSVASLIPQIVERAGVDAKTGGSITGFYTILADSDDLDDPIVDTARAIADGHIILSRKLAEQGVFPAIDINRSISRVANDLNDDQHRQAAQNFRQIWSKYEENADLLMMGAYRQGGDPVLDQAIALRDLQLNFIGQQHDVSIGLDGSVAQLIEEFV